MRIFLLVFHIMCTLFLIGIILLQPGEDAGGGSKTMSGQSNLLTKLTGILGTIFFLTSLIMGILIQRESSLKITPVSVAIENKDDLPKGSLDTLQKTPAIPQEAQKSSDKSQDTVASENKKVLSQETQTPLTSSRSTLPSEQSTVPLEEKQVSEASPHTGEKSAPEKSAVDSKKSKK